MFVSHTNTRQDTSQWVTHYGSANQEFADTSVRWNEQKGVLIASVPSPLSPIPLPFSLSLYPLPLSTPAKAGLATNWPLTRVSRQKSCFKSPTSLTWPRGVRASAKIAVILRAVSQIFKKTKDFFKRLKYYLRCKQQFSVDGAVRKEILSRQYDSFIVFLDLFKKKQMTLLMIILAWVSGLPKGLGKRRF